MVYRRKKDKITPEIVGKFFFIHSGCGYVKFFVSIDVVGFCFNSFIFSNKLHFMGQVHPNSFRFKFINYNFFKQKKDSFLINVFSTHLFCFSNFKNKLNYGQTVTRGILFNKIILTFFLKSSYFINNFCIFENPSFVLVGLKIFRVNQKKDTAFYSFDFNFLFKHFEWFLFNKKPIRFFIIFMDNTLCLSIIKNFSLFSKKRLVGCSELATLGFSAKQEPCAISFNLLFCYFFEKTKKQRELISFIKDLFSFLYFSKKVNWRGMKFQVKGRVGGSDRSKKHVFYFGPLPLTTISNVNVDFFFSKAVTPYGVCGVKIWFVF